MKTDDLTTKNVMSEVYYQNDSAYLNSNDITSKENESYENDELFNAAVEVADQELEGYELIEIEDCGNYSRAIWHKIEE